MKRIVTVTLNPCIDKTIIIDGFEYGGLNRVQDQTLCVGGKGINCSVVLNSMGCSVFSCGITAESATQQYLDSLGIPCGYTVCQGKLRTNYKIVNGVDKVTTEINEPGFEVTKTDLDRFIALFDAATDDAGVVIISGSAPKGAEDDVYYQLTKIAEDKNIPVILDADGDKMAQGIKAVPHCVKPNLFELEQLTGEALPTVEKQISAVKSLIAQGIKLVVLSLGADGALVADHDKVIKVYAPKVLCKSTVGAGDSMVAAVAYGIAKGLDIETIGKMAVCAGSLTAQVTGLCNGKDILNQYSNIKAEIIG